MNSTKSRSGTLTQKTLNF